MLLSVLKPFQSNDNQVLWELMGGPPKTRNMSACWQDGRFFAENETWVVDSCTRCTCKVRPAARAAQPLALAGQPPWRAVGCRAARAAVGEQRWPQHGAHQPPALRAKKAKSRGEAHVTKGHRPWAERQVAL